MVACKYLNLVLGNSEKSKLYWQFNLKRDLNDKYRYALSPEEFSIHTPLRDTNLLIQLFKRVVDLMVPYLMILALHFPH